jgi:ribosome-interacting GTPase 1
MPFGLTNAPASFQRFINEVLQEYLHSFVITYLDDILIFSKEKEEHVQHVSKVLEKLQGANIKLKLKKCELYVQETEFLGHWISTEGIHMDQNKVNAILEWP